MAITLALSLGWLGGCSDDDDDEPTPPGPTSTTFTGVFANSSENGSMSATINTTSLAAPYPGRLAAATRPLGSASAIITASGTLRPIGGSAISLSGTYNDATDSLNLSGSGYTLIGVHDTTGTFDAMIGPYNGPNGPGFFGCVTGLTNLSTYCGTFTSGSTPAHGNWDILIAGGQVGGIAFPEGADPFSFEGTIATTGTMRAITAGDASPGEYQITVLGTLNTTTNTVSGTWTYEDFVTPSTDSGTWTGSLCP